MSERKQDSKDGFLWGVALVLMGVFFLLVQQDVLPEHLLHDWWRWWPAILIAFGLVKLIRRASADDVGSGTTMVLMGFWFFANQFEWYGLRWRTSWPLALVAVGLGMVAKAVAIALMRGPGKEEARG